MKGWIKIYRSIKDHWLYPKNRPMTELEAWITILLEVNHEEEKVKIGNEVLDCHRGEKLYSLDSWGKIFGWNKSKVRRFFNTLETDTMIVQKPTHKTTQITVCNYESYQGERNSDETQMKRKPTPIEEVKKNNKNILSDIFLFQVDKSTLNDNQKKYFEIAFSFWEIISKNMSDLKIKSKNIENPTYGKWVEPIRQLFEIDKRTIEEIRGVFKFLKHDEFWRAQIRSTSKLRKKNKNDVTYFEELLIQSKNEKIGRNNSGKSAIPSNDEALAGIITRIEQSQL